MLKIKLARFGKKKQPHYRIVINEARDKRDGKAVDIIGHYDSTLTPKVLTIDVKKYEEWLSKGAQPTPTVAALYTRLKSGNPFPTKKPKLSKKAKAKAAAAQEAAAQPAPAESAPEAAATEAAPASETTEATTEAAA